MAHRSRHSTRINIRSPAREIDRNWASQPNVFPVARTAKENGHAASHSGVGGYPRHLGRHVHHLDIRPLGAMHEQQEVVMAPIFLVIGLLAIVWAIA
jgi:hypothetical protein